MDKKTPTTNQVGKVMLVCGIYLWLIGLGMWIAMNFAKWATQGESTEDLIPGSATITVFVVAIVGIIVGLALIPTPYRKPEGSQPPDEPGWRLTKLDVIAVVGASIAVGAMVLLAMGVCVISV